MKRAFALVFFTIACVLTAISLYKIVTTSAPDFSIFYTAAKDVTLGISPYTDHHLFTAFNYPLTTALFFIPVSVLSFSQALVLFTLLTMGSVFISVYFCFVLMKKKFSFIAYLLFVSFALLSFPTKFTFGMGQVNLIAYAFLLGSFALVKKHFWWTVVFLLIAIFLKPILGITFVIFLFEKKWKLFLTSIFLLGILFLLTPIVTHQPQANQLFLHLLSNQSLAGREVYYNQGFVGFVSRLTPNIFLRGISETILAILSLACLVYFLPKASFTEKLSLVLTILLIADPLSWQHHFVFLLFPFFLIFYSLQKLDKISLYMLYAVSVVLISWNFKTPQLLTYFPASLLLSTQLYGAVILLFLELYMLRKSGK